MDKIVKHLTKRHGSKVANRIVRKAKYYVFGDHTGEKQDYSKWGLKDTLGEGWKQALAYGAAGALAGAGTAAVVGLPLSVGATLGAIGSNPIENWKSKGGWEEKKKRVRKLLHTHKVKRLKAKLAEMDNWDGKSHSPSFKLQKSQPLPGGGRRDTYRDTSKFAQIQQRNLQRNRAENLARHKADPSPRPGRPGSEVQKFKGDW